MRKVKALLVFACAAVVIACGISPKIYKFDRSVDYPTNFDTTWAAVMEVLAENSIPVDNLEKASGYVSTQKFKVPNEYADSGKTPIGVKLIGPLYGTFNVFVKERPGGTSVQINCSYQLDTDNIYYKSWESTGAFETTFHQALAFKLSK